jgi:hypothetical protein
LLSQRIERSILKGRALDGDSNIRLGFLIID